MAETDGDLMARIQAGDALALHALYARHHVKLFRFAMRRVGAESSAQQALSEVFLDLWRAPPSGTISTLLLASVHRKAQASDAEPPREIRTLRDCLAALSPEHRETMDLVYYHDKTALEVAEIVGVSESAARGRLLDARRRLAELAEGAGIRAAAPASDDADEIEQMLPWFAAGTLGEAGAKVEAALAERGELRSSLATIEEDRGETIALNEALGAPSPEVWTGILVGVAATPRKIPLSRRLAAWLGFGVEARSPGLTLAALAAGFVIAAQAATIVTLLRPAPPKHAFAGPARAEARVGFARDAKIAQISALLEAQGARIIGGPSPAGLYELQLGVRPLSAPEIAAAVKALAASPIVTLALPAPGG